MSVKSQRAFYTKKPIAIEAYQWHGHNPNKSEDRVVRYYRHPDNKGTNVCHHCGSIMHVHGWIDTLEGGHIVCPSDWIIKGIRGEVYPCKNNIFTESYSFTSDCPVELEDAESDESFDKIPLRLFEDRN